MRCIVSNIGDYIMPIMALIIIIFGLCKKVSVFDVFSLGAKDGLTTTFRIIPALVGLMVSVSMLKASGALDIITYALSPIAKVLGLPSEVLPLALLRPVSGSGSLALIENILSEYGPDSFIGRVASVIQGSTETTFYCVAVYFGSVGIKDTRHTIPSALASDCVGIIARAIAVRLFFDIL